MEANKSAVGHGDGFEEGLLCAGQVAAEFVDALFEFAALEQADELAVGGDLLAGVLAQRVHAGQCESRLAGDRVSGGDQPRRPWR